MDFVTEKSNGQKVNDPDWGQIEKSLNQIGKEDNCYFILTADSGAYLQCAGGQERLTIEYRETLGTKSNHYVLGRKPGTNVPRTVWQNIECHVGPIKVHDNEVLTLDDALTTFKFFFEHSAVPHELNKRNVTRKMTNSTP